MAEIRHAAPPEQRPAVDHDEDVRIIHISQAAVEDLVAPGMRSSSMGLSSQLADAIRQLRLRNATWPTIMANIQRILDVIAEGGAWNVVLSKVFAILWPAEPTDGTPLRNQIVAFAMGCDSYEECQCDPETLKAVEREVDADALPRSANDRFAGMELDSRRPALFLRVSRARMATELAKSKGITRGVARQLVDEKSDDEVLMAADRAGVPRDKIGDGTFIQWFITNGPAIFAFIMKILPMLGLL